jgi:MraZ protein
MLLTGTYERTLDDKKRLALAKRMREQLGEPATLYVTPWPDGCLCMYTSNDLNQLAQKLNRTPATDKEARVFRRLYFARTEEVDVDKSGRVLIPDRLIAFAGLHDRVVLIGVQDHLELWDAERWRLYEEQHSPRFDAVAESAFRVGDEHSNEE